MTEEKDKPKYPDENDRLKDGTLPKDPKEGTKTVKEAPRVLTVEQILAASEERAKQAKGKKFCSTGHYLIDRYTGGMQDGDCWLFGAETSFGKSSFAIQLVDVNLKMEKRVLIVSSEDSEELYGDRLMCRRAGLDAKDYRDGNLTKEEWELVARTRASGEPVPVFVDARPHKIERLEAHLNKIVVDQSINLIVFDYLQEFQSTRKHQDERVKFKEIAAVMRRVVKGNKRTGIIMSQLTITPGKKSLDKNNIRESRDVSNAAETILIGYLQDTVVYEKDKNGNDVFVRNSKGDYVYETKDGHEQRVRKILWGEGDRMLLIDKCKRGPRGDRVKLDWDNRTASFKVTKDPEQQRIDDVYDNVTEPDDFEEG